MYFGRYNEIIDRREIIKRETLKNRREENLKQSKIIHESTAIENVKNHTLVKQQFCPKGFEDIQ